MKKGTILLNTYASENNPLKTSIYIGKSKQQVMTLYVYKGKLRKARFEEKELHKHLIPVGYTDVLERFVKEIEETLNRPYEAEDKDSEQ